MKWLDKIKQWFIGKTVEEVKPIIKTLQNIEIFDTVWVLEDNTLYEGWIFDKTKNILSIIYKGNEELKVRYNRPLDRSFIEDNSFTIFFNK